MRDVPREAFEVFEDGQLQTITQFTGGRVPVSVAILLDISESMFGPRLEDSRAALVGFASDLLDPADEVAVLAFNHDPHRLTSWTSDPGAAAKVLQPLKAFGSTAVYDAIGAALPLIARRNRQRAAVLVVSDGADTASETTLRELRSALLRTDAFVYAIAIDPPERWPINTRVNASALREVTDQSGGRTFVVTSSADATAALASIAEELNSQYLIGYTSPKAGDGQYHRIRVRVRDTDHRVRARNGYVASAPR